MHQKTGFLFYNADTDRYDISFRNGETYGGLHCGMTFDVRISNQWIPTRIEYAGRWYLVGVDIPDLESLPVRIRT